MDAGGIPLERRRLRPLSFVFKNLFCSTDTTDLRTYIGNCSFVFLAPHLNLVVCNNLSIALNDLAILILVRQDNVGN